MKAIALLIAGVSLCLLAACMSPRHSGDRPGPGREPGFDADQGRGREPLDKQTLARLQAIGVIDTSAHLVGMDGAGRGDGSADYGAALKNAAIMMDRLGVRKTILAPVAYSFQDLVIVPAEKYAGNIFKDQQRFAFLGGGGTLNPMMGQAVSQGQLTPAVWRHFEQTVKDLLGMGIKGFGQLSALSFARDDKQHYICMPPDNPLMLRLADLAAQYGVPIDLSMELVSQPSVLPPHLRATLNPYDLEPNLAAFERLLAHNRRAKIVWANAGRCNTGQRTVEAMTRLLAQHPNLYMAISVSPDDGLRETSPMGPGRKIKPQWLEMLKRFPDRFVIGSGQQFMAASEQGQGPGGSGRRGGPGGGMGGPGGGMGGPGGGMGGPGGGMGGPGGGMGGPGGGMGGPGGGMGGHGGGMGGPGGGMGGPGGGGGGDRRGPSLVMTLLPTMEMLAALPEDLARKIGHDNAVMLYNLQAQP